MWVNGHPSRSRQALTEALAPESYAGSVRCARHARVGTKKNPTREGLRLISRDTPNFGSTPYSGEIEQPGRLPILLTRLLTMVLDGNGTRGRPTRK